ncbi:MAG: outer membrane protein assembly factor BamA [Candidatus Krumholzibacteria bacterium]|nr:outer membrane protein assembly factor BamA [Candidatus Krumholzibacteria bacterium]
MIRVVYFSQKNNNYILAQKCRKPHRYTTTLFPVKILEISFGPSVFLALLLLLIGTAARPVGAQQDEAASAPEQAPYVNKVLFVGNESISKDKLQNRIKTKAPAFYNIFRKPRLDMTTLRRDIAQLEGYYHSAGFFEASVTLESLDYSEDRRFVDVVISIREGKPTLVESVDFSENSLVDPDELRKGLLLKPGDPYNASYLDSDLYTVQSEYFDRGYLAVAINESVDIQAYRARIHFEIDPGTQIRIRNIEISGNERSRTRVIEKEIAFESGDICRLNKLIETQRNLYETGLFTVVDINPENLDPLERTVDISVRVRERKAAWVEGGFGVGNILGSRIFAGWGTRNLKGTGLGLRLKIEYGYDLFEGETIKLDEIQFRNNYWRYGLEYFQRYLLGLKILMSIDAFVEKDATVENVVVRRVGGRFLTRRRITRYTDMLVGFTNEFITRSVFGRPADESQVRYITNSYSHDKRDFILNPHKGIYRFLRLKLAGGILGGTEDFYTASASSQWYWPLLRSDVLALRVRAGYGDHYGQSEVIPIEDRYFAGGSNSVRGYENNSLGPKIVNEETGEFLPLGGRALLLTNIEFRFEIPVLSRINISGAAFFDGGNVWEDPKNIKISDFQLVKSDSDVDINDYRYGIGLGIRYNTPVGPIRLDYGVPLKVEEGQSDNGLFYLSLGQTF